MKTMTKGKVAAPSSKSSIGKKSQPVTGKLAGGMQSMPGSKGKGQAVKTAPSNPIQGKTKSTGTAMGGSGVIDGFA